MIKTRADRRNPYSPLRYPGGKACLYDFFCSVIQSKDLESVTYIEPYAGGAGAAISLLIKGKVDKIIINDYDVAIYALWKSIIEHPRAFINRIRKTPLSIEEWKKQKEIYKKKDIKKYLDLGFATFYLNRSNRSGILEAGPIGGFSQNGQWKINARFNKESLINKVKQIAERRSRITVLNQDGIEVITQYANKENVLFYIDPPYYTKGAKLYLNAFNHAKHQELADVLNSHTSINWLLSYDEVDEIKTMYIPAGRKYETFSLSYSAHRNIKSGSELMIFSDAIDPFRIN